jgi:hypothetical protein
MPIVAVIAAASSIAQAAGSVFNTFKTMLSGGVSPSPTWEEVDPIAVSSATKLTQTIVNLAGEENVPAIFASYTPKLRSYIEGSPHNKAQQRGILEALQTEAIEMRPNFTPDAFPFDRIPTDQLAWAIWLHAHWLYEGVSRDEVSNGNALRKFNESLGPTLSAAVSEGSGVNLAPGPKDNVYGPADTATNTGVKVAAKAGMSTTTMILLVGAAVGLLYFSAKGKG